MAREFTLTLRSSARRAGSRSGGDLIADPSVNSAWRRVGKAHRIVPKTNTPPQREYPLLAEPNSPAR
jgi:hypothetical protein